MIVSHRCWTDVSVFHVDSNALVLPGGNCHCDFVGALLAPAPQQEPAEKPYLLSLLGHQQRPGVTG